MFFHIAAPATAANAARAGGPHEVQDKAGSQQSHSKDAWPREPESSRSRRECLRASAFVHAKAFVCMHVWRVRICVGVDQGVAYVEDRQGKLHRFLASLLRVLLAEGPQLSGMICHAPNWAQWRSKLPSWQREFPLWQRQFPLWQRPARCLIPSVLIPSVCCAQHSCRHALRGSAACNSTLALVKQGQPLNNNRCLGVFRGSLSRDVYGLSGPTN
eukprot:186136-Chlamydomonas_euryale.AAC.8